MRIVAAPFVAALVALALPAAPAAAQVPEPGLDSFDRYVDVFPYTYCLPPETLADRTWEFLGLWPLYEVYIDPVHIVFDRGVFDVWLLFSATVGGRRGGTDVPPSMVQRMRVDCAERSFRIDEEHYFAGGRGTGCYLGRKGTFFDGHALDRQPPGWKRDILPNRPVALAAERLCPSVVPP